MCKRRLQPRGSGRLRDVDLEERRDVEHGAWAEVLRELREVCVARHGKPLAERHGAVRNGVHGIVADRTHGAADRVADAAIGQPLTHELAACRVGSQRSASDQQLEHGSGRIETVSNAVQPGCLRAGIVDGLLVGAIEVPYARPGITDRGQHFSRRRIEHHRGAVLLSARHDALLQGCGRTQLQPRIDGQVDVAVARLERAYRAAPRPVPLADEREELCIVAGDRRVTLTGPRIEDFDGPGMVVEALEPCIAVALDVRRVARAPVALVIPITDDMEGDAGVTPVQPCGSTQDRCYPPAPTGLARTRSHRLAPSVSMPPARPRRLQRLPARRPAR